MPAYALTIFTGAFLLFQVQPLIGKFILPWFGGAPAVWTTCLLFFQSALLLGYAYAHGISRCKPRTQAVSHLLLLAAALALLPITPADTWKPDGSGNPTLQILGLLSVTIGLPYFVLSATGPLIQHWFSRTHRAASPYRLYALSNLGSLLGLVTFPVLFETHFSRRTMAAFFGWGLVVYAVGCCVCAMKLWRLPAPEAPAQAGQSKDAAAPALRLKVLWLLLPACASMLLLATTNKICQEVAVIPFLWVLPLSLYLLSFIICFDSSRWYVRPVFIPALTLSWGALWLLSTIKVIIPLPVQISVYCVAFFCCCMVCHGELYRLKPDPRHLTGFYLMIAAGGALGGLLVAVVAPLVFTDYFEWQIGLLSCGLLFLAVCARDWNGQPERPWRRAGCVWLCVCLTAFAWVLCRPDRFIGGVKLEKSRNFYGVLTVATQGTNTNFQRVELTHGRTLHGMQFADPQRAIQPTLYYVTNSGVGMAMQALPDGPRRVGLVGLGAGTLAAYARPGDYYHIYEINPEVERLARSHFTYLGGCRGEMELTLGDARLSLEKEPAQNFDLLVLDAFSSDSIPVHLLTREAFLVYQRHLKTNGIIAVHVSNRALNLEPVVDNLARCFKYSTATIEYTPDVSQQWLQPSIWVLLSTDEKVIDSPAIWLASRPAVTGSVHIPLWTDDFASLFQILRTIKDFHTDPEFTKAQALAAYNLCQRGDYVGAVASYEEALKTHPDMPDLMNNFAWLLATCPDPHSRNGARAVEYAERACERTHYAKILLIGTLAAAYAEAGRFDEAIATAKKNCALARAAGAMEVLKKNEELLALYEAHQPYHEDH